MLQAAIDVAATAAAGALLATGVSLAWGVRRMFPLHLGGILALAATAAGGASWVSGPRGILLAVIICLALAAAFDWLIDRPLRRREPTEPLLASVAALAALAGLAMHPLPWAVGPMAPLGFAGGPATAATSILIALLLLAVLAIIGRRTKLGLAMRAVGFDPDTAALVGINPDRVLLHAALLSTLVVGAGGILYGLRLPAATHLELLHLVSLALAGGLVAGPNGHRRLHIAATAGLVLGALDGAIIATWPEGHEMRFALPLLAAVAVLPIRPAESTNADAPA